MNMALTLVSRSQLEVGMLDTTLWLPTSSTVSTRIDLHGMGAERLMQTISSQFNSKYVSADLVQNSNMILNLTFLPSKALTRIHSRRLPVCHNPEPELQVQLTRRFYHPTNSFSSTMLAPIIVLLAYLNLRYKCKLPL